MSNQIKSHLSAAMERMLLDIHRTGNPFQSINGRSQYGGAGATLSALRRRGLVDFSNDGTTYLTPTGKKAVIDMGGRKSRA